MPVCNLTVKTVNCNGLGIDWGSGATTIALILSINILVQ